MTKNHMGIVPGIFTVCSAVLIVFSALADTPKSTHHFFDVAGNTLEKFEPVWDVLNSKFGKLAPARIVVRVTNDQYSRFDPHSNTVLIKASHYDTNAARLIGHESAHLAVYRATKGKSIENRYRFIDEGFASVFGSRVAGAEKEFKKKFLRIAAEQQRLGNISFELVQDWRAYWGNPRDKGTKPTSYAYPVAASFIHFIEDNHGADASIRLVGALGASQNLDTAMRLAFNSSAREIEFGWISYLKKVPFAKSAIAGPPNIVGIDPPNGASGISQNREELLVEFSTNMKNLVCIGTRSCEDICYHNAYWKTPRLLVIKLPNQLRPNRKYSVSLGIKERCRLKSTDNIDLPVTQWNFQTSRD